MTSTAFWMCLTAKYRDLAAWQGMVSTLLLTVLMLVAVPVFAQDVDSTDKTPHIDMKRGGPSPDSSSVKLNKQHKKGIFDKSRRHSPKTAAILSAALPGLGQIYNRKHWWWKVPIIYGGFAGLGYSVYFNQSNFVKYRDGYRTLVGDTSLTRYPVDGTQYSASQLKELRSFYKRNRDLSIIFITVLYGLNILDATVQAHLFDFDVSDDMSLHIMPDYRYDAALRSSYVGIRLNLRL